MVEPSSEERMELARKGEAMPDGSYYVRDCAELKNAVQAYGRETGDKSDLRHFLIKRSIALDCMEKIPEDWEIEVEHVNPT